MGRVQGRCCCDGRGSMVEQRVRSPRARAGIESFGSCSLRLCKRPSAKPILTILLLRSIEADRSLSPSHRNLKYSIEMFPSSKQENWTQILCISFRRRISSVTLPSCYSKYNIYFLYRYSNSTSGKNAVSSCSHRYYNLIIDKFFAGYLYLCFHICIVSHVN